MSVFLTDNEMRATFLAAENYVAPVEIAASGPLPSVDGLHAVFVDTTGGPITVDLPSTPPSRYEPWIINVGTGDLTINGTINGVSTPHLIASQWFGIAIRNNDGDLFAAVRSFVVAGPAVFFENATFQSSPQEVSASFGVYGIAVDSSGTRAVISATQEDNGGTDRGAVYVFDLVGGLWTQTQRLVPSTPEDNAQFGTALAIDGDRIVVGCHSEDVGGLNRGAVYVFDLAGTWSETQKLTASIPQDADSFGFAVALDGDRIMVGTPSYGTPNRGAVHVFDFAGTWSETQILTASPGEDGQQFGLAIDLQGTRCTISAPSESNGGSARGAAYVFDLSGTWTQTQRITPSIAQNGASFGRSVSLDGDTIVVGAPKEDGAFTNEGAAYVFDLSGTWSETQRLSTGKNRGEFGWVVRLRGDTILVSAPLESLTSFSFEGNAYQFTLDSGSFFQIAELKPTTQSTNMAFGYSMDFAGSVAMFSDQDNDDAQRGTVYYYNR